MIEYLSGLLSRIWHSNTFLQLFSIVLFALLVPLFSVVSVWGIRRVAQLRQAGLEKTYPAVSQTLSYALYTKSETRGISQVTTARYVVPILFLFLLNLLMSMILLDFMGFTDNAIQAKARVFILCGGHCTDLKDDLLVAYQTQTFVAAAYAYLGWMVWTFSTIFDRATALQLFPSTFNRLLIRFVIAVLVAIVVRHLVEAAGDIVKISGPVLSFVIGMFPETGLAMIASKYKDWIRTDVHSEDFQLDLVEGISPSMTYRLVEIGVEDGAALAAANPFTIFDASVTPLSEIVDWIAQAQLLMLMQSGRFQTL